MQGTVWALADQLPIWTTSCPVRNWSSASWWATARWARPGWSLPGQPTRRWQDPSSSRLTFPLSGPSTSIACVKRWVRCTYYDFRTPVLNPSGAGLPPPPPPPTKKKKKKKKNTPSSLCLRPIERHIDVVQSSIFSFPLYHNILGK